MEMSAKQISELVSRLGTSVLTDGITGGYVFRPDH
jgi:hypothetical protein